MQFKEYKYLVYSDLYRVTGHITPAVLIWQIFFGEAFKYIFWMRTCSYARSNIFFKYSVYPIAKLRLTKLRYKLGISIAPNTKIGSGFYIGHFGEIIVNVKCEIGKNCNISHGVTLGQSNRGSKRGCPILGDNIYIGPGAKVFGAIKIGNNVAIGANCVVTEDVPDNSVVVGNPGIVISHRGSKGYVARTEYEGIIN